jgi:sec-independent protein translocase protein TatA
MTGLTSPLHIVILLLIVLLLFGAKRLPEIGGSLGKGMREFKGALMGEDEHKPAAPAPELVTPTPVATPEPPVSTTAPDQHNTV